MEPIIRVQPFGPDFIVTASPAVDAIGTTVSRPELRATAVEILHALALSVTETAELLADVRAWGAE